ncbi:unnamed protein product [Amoebophrya sp. A120]|nr:unnamed protein product [Amoebophrya sp. A120]|eukprot:GSA120T00012035001.1
MGRNNRGGKGKGKKKTGAGSSAAPPSEQWEEGTTEGTSVLAQAEDLHSSSAPVPTQAAHQQQPLMKMKPDTPLEKRSPIAEHEYHGDNDDLSSEEDRSEEEDLGSAQHVETDSEVDSSSEEDDASSEENSDVNRGGLFSTKKNGTISGRTTEVPTSASSSASSASSAEETGNGSTTAADQLSSQYSTQSAGARPKTWGDEVCHRVPIVSLSVTIALLHYFFSNLVISYDPRYERTWYLYKGLLTLFLAQLFSLIFGGLEKKNYIPYTWGFQYDVDQLSDWMLQRTTDNRLRGCIHCQGFKPDRAQHCRMTGRCVLKLDHWCPFLLQTIGYYNYVPFVRLLAISSLLLASMSCVMFDAVSSRWIKHFFLRYYGGNIAVALKVIFAATIPIFCSLVFGLTVFRLARPAIPWYVRAADCLMNTLAIACLLLNELVVIPYLTEGYAPFFAITTQTVLAFLSVLLIFFFGFHLHLASRNETTFEHWAKKRQRVPIVDFSLGTKWANLRNSGIVSLQFVLPYDIVFAPLSQLVRVVDQKNKNKSEEDASVDDGMVASFAELRRGGYVFDTAATLKFTAQCVLDKKTE